MFEVQGIWLLAVENLRTELVKWIYRVHEDKRPLKRWWLKALASWLILMQACALSRGACERVIALHNFVHFSSLN